MKLATTIKVVTDDGKPLDAEHIRAVAGFANGDTLTQVNEKLAQCKRPAHAVRRDN